MARGRKKKADVEVECLDLDSGREDFPSEHDFEVAANEEPTEKVEVSHAPGKQIMLKSPVRSESAEKQHYQLSKFSKFSQ